LGGDDLCGGYNVKQVAMRKVKDAAELEKGEFLLRLGSQIGKESGLSLT